MTAQSKLLLIKIRMIIKAKSGILLIKKHQGFTLIELFIVIIIFGILAAIALPILTMLPYGEGCGTPQGQRYISLMNKQQKANYSENGAFVTSVEKLSKEIPQQNFGYNYSIQVRPNAVFNYATSRNKSVRSYVGAVFIVKNPAQPAKVISIICKANQIGQIIPTDPIYKNGSLVCGSKTNELNFKARTR